MSRKKKKPRFTFSDAEVPFGTKLEPYFLKKKKLVVVFWQRKGEVVRVADDKNVWCDDILIPFNSLTGYMLAKIGRKTTTGDQSCRHWKLDGEKLDDRRNRLYIIREARQKGELHV